MSNFHAQTKYCNLAHFAALKKYTGFYLAASDIEAFKEEISQYEGSKVTIKFLVDKPIPLNLISKIVKCKIKENLRI